MNHRKQLEVDILTEDEIVEINKKHLGQRDYYREEDVKSILDDIESRVSAILDGISLASNLEGIQANLRDLRDDLY